MSSISDTDSLIISCGESAFLNRIGVILFTLSSVHCADNNTAISRVYGSLCCKGIGVLGYSFSNFSIIYLTLSCLFIIA